VAWTVLGILAAALAVERWASLSRRVLRHYRSVAVFLGGHDSLEQRKSKSLDSRVIKPAVTHGAKRRNMTRKRHNNLKAKANRRFAEAVCSALGDARKKALKLCWAIEALPASEDQTKCSVMASELYQCLGPNAKVSGGSPSPQGFIGR